MPKIYKDEFIVKANKYMKSNFELSSFFMKMKDYMKDTKLGKNIPDYSKPEHINLFKVVFIHKPKAIGTMTSHMGAIQLKQLEGILPDGRKCRWNNPIQTVQEMWHMSQPLPLTKNIKLYLELPLLWSKIAESFEKAGHKIPDTIREHIKIVKETGEYFYKLGESTSIDIE